MRSIEKWNGSKMCDLHISTYFLSSLRLTITTLQHNWNQKTSQIKKGMGRDIIEIETMMKKKTFIHIFQPSILFVNSTRIWVFWMIGFLPLSNRIKKREKHDSRMRQKPEKAMKASWQDRKTLARWEPERVFKRKIV